MVTKWDLLQADLDAARSKVDRIVDEIKWLEETPLWEPDGTDGGAGPMRCGTCGKELPTEADFAKHYTVPDIRFRNLGHCPTRDEHRIGPKHP